MKIQASILVLIVALAALFSSSIGAASTLQPTGRFNAIRLSAGTAGTLDRTFGGSGFIVIRHNPYSVNDVRVTTNGDIVVAVDFAGMAGGIGGFAIQRLLPNGAPDISFGNGGIALAQFSSGINFADSTATQVDGKIVAVGTAVPVDHSPRTIAIARFNQNGSLDTSFGTGGRLSILVPNSSGSGAGVVLLEPNGKLLVGGGASFVSGSSGVLVRLNSNGSIDGSFGIGGFASTGIAGRVNGLGLQSDGKIVALNGAAAVRLLGNGAGDLNTTRGTLVAETHNGLSMLTDDEHIILSEGLSGGQGVSDLDTQVFRLFPNGSVDATFQRPIFDFTPLTTDIFQQIPQAVAIQSNGSIIVGGGAVSSQGNLLFGLARLVGNGAFDTSFGQRGITVSQLDGGDQLLALGLQPNGDILAAGIDMSNNGGLVVARYLPK